MTNLIYYRNKTDTNLNPEYIHLDLLTNMSEIIKSLGYLEIPDKDHIQYLSSQVYMILCQIGNSGIKIVDSKAVFDLREFESSIEYHKNIAQVHLMVYPESMKLCSKIVLSKIEMLSRYYFIEQYYV